MKKFEANYMKVKFRIPSTSLTFWPAAEIQKNVDTKCPEIKSSGHRNRIRITKF